jgi:hypothetical protein
VFDVELPRRRKPCGSRVSHKAVLSNPTISYTRGVIANRRRFSIFH